MASSTFQITNLRTGAVRLLVGPDGTLVQLVATLQRRVMARAKVNTPVDTGFMRNSHVADPPRVVGTRVVGEVKNTARYSKAVHDGTRAHVIRPRNASVLRFQIGGRTVFARQVNMPARQGRPWLMNAFKQEAAQLGFRVTGE
jgi:hypothetical protein